MQYVQVEANKAVNGTDKEETLDSEKVRLYVCCQ